ncbi:MAG: molybdopterin molybdotransferase MoeA [Nitrospirae bacterium]|nr:molybdopterin molybdotransferase MoeA [Nitrospirota bacterium]
MNDKQDDPVAAAVERFFSAFPAGPIGTETIGLSVCRGRVLAGDVNAGINSPPFSRALVEGFLVNVKDTDGAGDNTPVTLSVSGMIEVGMMYDASISHGMCIEVSTGSFVPEGEYAVVRYMDISKSNNVITIKRPFKKGDFIETAGCEIKKGDLILKQGTRLSAREIMTLAGQGILSVNAVKRPAVAIFCSGNEVIPPSEPLKPGHVWDANSYTLSAQIEDYGGVPIFCGIMKDDFSTFKEALKNGLNHADMAVISGGTAIGGRDFIADLINSLGTPGVIVNGVPMRSGKPLIMGVIGNKPIVCVAGYPPESLRGFDLFGKPAIERLLGVLEKASEQK